MLVVLLSQQAYRPGNKTNEQLTDKVTQLLRSGTSGICTKELTYARQVQGHSRPPVENVIMQAVVPKSVIALVGPYTSPHALRRRSTSCAASGSQKRWRARHCRRRGGSCRRPWSPAGWDPTSRRTAAACSTWPAPTFWESPATQASRWGG
jgi:hypothetical protein